MRRTGVRRICVISGEAEWVAAAALAQRQTMTGDWLTVSGDPVLYEQSYPPAVAVKRLPGREFLHAVFDARYGFHAEALATLAGTLLAGSWLLLLLPPRDQWSEWRDQDSLRWADTTSAIAVPCFMRHLNATLSADKHISYWCQHQPVAPPPVIDAPPWQCGQPGQQHSLLQQLRTMDSGVAIVTAARGRGKSALAGMLAHDNPGTLISAPAKVSVAVLQQFAGQHFQFMAPDALAALPATETSGWLIVDEAAAVPAPLLHRMISRFRRVLLCTTVQGYEGTGRGFLLRFCAGLPQASKFTLTEPLRWSAADPLEPFIGQLFLFDDTEEVLSGDRWQAVRPAADYWQSTPEKARAVYRLLTAAHYRTTPLDLRRIMDAPGMHFLLAEEAQGLRGAAWLLEEGGLPGPLSEAVWAGFRRPKGNLVAQSLAAHGGFPQAAGLKSLRISRIAVNYHVRRQGTGRSLVRSAIDDAKDYDYLSVSFGFTDELWQFWQHCGFRLVRLGTQREASSGCYAAMAVYPLSAAGRELTEAAEQRLQRDWLFLSKRWFSDPAMAQAVPPARGPGVLAEDDWPELAGFGFGSRSFESAYPALMRLREHAELNAPCLNSIATGQNTETEEQSISAVGGRKVWLRMLRDEVSGILRLLDNPRAEQWQQRLDQLRKI